MTFANRRDFVGHASVNGDSYTLYYNSQRKRIIINALGLYLVLGCVNVTKSNSLNHKYVIDMHSKG